LGTKLAIPVPTRFVKKLKQIIKLFFSQRYTAIMTEVMSNIGEVLYYNLSRGEIRILFLIFQELVRTAANKDNGNFKILRSFIIPR
jgi:hypothetical protein